MTMTRDEALDRLRGNDLLQLGMDADEVRQQRWPEAVVTYSVGFPVTVGSGIDAAQVRAAAERGAQALVVSTGPDAEINAVLADLQALQGRFPELLLTGFSAMEVDRLGDASTVLRALRRAGLAMFGSGIPSFGSGGVDAGWIAAHRAAHTAGLPTIGVLLLRAGDTPEDWVRMLEDFRNLQDETQGFLACEPRIEAMERALDEVTGAQYLKMVALCRLYLESVPHLQVDWRIFGPKVLQVALRFGADDAGVVVATERDRLTPSHHSGEEELRRIIRDAGYRPSARDAVYGRQFAY